MLEAIKPVVDTSISITITISRYSGTKNTVIVYIYLFKIYRNAYYNVSKKNLVQGQMFLTIF